MVDLGSAGSDMRRVRLALVPLLALAMGGCASVSLPFGGLGERAPEHTASTGTPALETARGPATAMPAELSAVTPIPAPVSREPSARPMDDLIASLPAEQAVPLTLTQADLNAMGRALTHVLQSDADAGTFSWSHEATGRSGLMTPFRQLGMSGDADCRVVSVEITDGGNDKILLADACLREGRWVFVTPRAGETL